MKITNVEHGWDDKVNFTDSNDVFVGFDMSQCCCEDAGWFISFDPDEKYQFDGNKCEEGDFNGYVFDIEFFKSIDSEDLDDGGQVCFRLTHKEKPDAYLHIYNAHNGYYSHGFEALIGGVDWQKDYI